MDIKERAKLISEQKRQDLEADFVPAYGPEQMPQLDLRMALAAEYSAYQMGQLNKKLDKLIELLLSTRAQT
jgi:hypothetical protein